MDILIVLLLICYLPRGIPLIPIYFLLRNNSNNCNFHEFKDSSSFSQKKSLLFNRPFPQNLKTKNINPNFSEATTSKLKYYNHQIIPNYTYPNKHRNINCSPPFINYHLNRVPTDTENIPPSSNMIFKNNNVLKNNNYPQNNSHKKTYDNIKNNNTFNINTNEEEQLITKLPSNSKYNSYNFIYLDNYGDLIDANGIPVDYNEVNYNQVNYEESNYGEINYNDIYPEYEENHPIPSTELNPTNHSTDESIPSTKLESINHSDDESVPSTKLESINHSDDEKEITLKETSSSNLKELSAPNSEDKELSNPQKALIPSSKENPIPDVIEKNFKGATISTILNGFGVITGEVVFNFNEVIALKLKNNTIVFINKKYVDNFF